MQWAIRVGGTDDETTRSIILDGSGNVSISGQFESATIDFGSTTLTNADNTGATTDMFVAKILSSTLPVELLSFTAKPVNNQTVLTEWITTNEVNSDYFTIEKSKDTDNWEYVGTVDGAGNSSTTLNYSLEDKTPYQGISYYRLKQTDFNGDFKYYGPVAVNLDGINIINLYPNPGIDHIDYSVVSSIKSNVTINLIDVLGKKVVSQANDINKGENKLQLDISDYPVGIYIIQLITESGKYRTQKQFMVQ